MSRPSLLISRHSKPHCGRTREKTAKMHTATRTIALVNSFLLSRLLAISRNKPLSANLSIALYFAFLLTRRKAPNKATSHNKFINSICPNLIIFIYGILKSRVFPSTDTIRIKASAINTKTLNNCLYSLYPVSSISVFSNLSISLYISRKVLVSVAL